MIRFGGLAWICLGALGLGLLTLEAIKRKRSIPQKWTFLAIVLGPVFLFFILPIWLGRWGRSVEGPESKDKS